MSSFPIAEETANWAQLRPPVVQPLYESRSDLEIIFDLATRLGLSEQFFNGDIDAALNYHLVPSGLTVRQLRANRMGMRVAVKTRSQKHTEVDPQTSVRQMESARLSPNASESQSTSRRTFEPGRQESRG